MNSKWVTILVILAVGLAGCGPAGAAEFPPSPIGPQAWFDAPLPGSVFRPPNPCQIVAHGGSPSGIAVFELSINGEAASIPSPDKSNSLVTLTQDCNLSQPGDYQLLLRAQDNDGNWSGYAETNLTIATEETPAETSISTPTSTPTSSPTMGNTALFSRPTLSTNHFYYNDTTCGDTGVTFGIMLLNNAASHVYLFYKVENQANGETSAWNEGFPMNPLGGNNFQFVLQGNSIPGLIIPTGIMTPSINYVVHYQFVATDASEGIVGRSDVYVDLLLSYCP